MYGRRPSARGDPRKEPDVIRLPHRLTLIPLASLATLVLPLSSPVSAGGHGSVQTSAAHAQHGGHVAPRAHVAPRHQHRCLKRCHHERWLRKHPYTGFVVEGRTSTFGYLTGDSEGTTADGGTTARPCIALRDDATLGHYFEVTVEGHSAKLIQCDWGPAESTGRSIDITGEGDEALGFSPSTYPTDAWGIARELK